MSLSGLNEKGCVSMKYEKGSSLSKRSAISMKKVLI